MKSIYPDAMFFVIPFWNGLTISLFWYGLMKCCVENGNLFRVYKSLFGYFNTFIINRIMQRRKRKQLFDLMFYLVCNKGCTCKVLTSMHYSMANGCNIIRAGYYRVFSLSE
ncbi:hypothetical protein SRABI64_06174 [Pseudomonas carnis]|nr:hypothetical protein SRABI64_06174 [Pseudomonas carnis]